MASTHYINNKEFLALLIAHRTALSEAEKKKLPAPPISDEIGLCFLDMAQRISKRPNFSSYTFREDMVSEAVENCLHGSTKILTQEYGPIAIKDICGEKVTVKARDGVWRPAQIQSFGKQPLYEYGFGSFNKQVSRLNQKVIATPNHRWFIKARLTPKNMFEWGDKVVTDLRLGDMLEQTPYLDGIDKKAIIHGIIFGDGSGHKDQVESHSPVVTQGTKYARIRVCKQDSRRDEIFTLLTEAGFTCTYPPSANGDPCFALGYMPYVKDVPFVTDPSYIRGFIYGWWLADGTKGMEHDRLQISTTNEQAVNWLIDHAAYAGYHLTSQRITSQDRKGHFPNGKPLHTITLAPNEAYTARVRSITYFGEEEVFCAVEPVTNGFTLANGLLTGNCLLYIRNFNPDISQNPFGYFTTTIYYAFFRRIEREKKDLYMKYKSAEMQGYVDSPIQDEMINTRHLTVYDNISDYINTFEQKREEKRIKQEKKKKKKGLETFMEEE